MSEPRTDFDSPWKDALEDYFEEFMAFFFPRAHADIGWQRGYEFLDTELQQVVRDAELGRRLADKLIRVWRRSGEERWVLVHVEVQSQPQVDFARRMYTYNYRLFDRYNRLVASLAVLADQHANWKPDWFGYDLWGCEVGFKFPVVKLLDYAQGWQTLEASSNPFSTVVMAHVKAQETQRDAQARQVWKLYLTRRLYERGYQRQDVVNLYRFIDWVMKLPEDLEADFLRQIHQYEEEQHMPYISTAERIGIEKGMQQGAFRQLVRVLRHRFGPVPEEVWAGLEALSVEQLEALLDVALTVDAMAAFASHLPSETSSGTQGQN